MSALTAPCAHCGVTVTHDEEAARWGITRWYDDNQLDVDCSGTWCEGAPEDCHEPVQESQ